MVLIFLDVKLHGFQGIQMDPRRSFREPIRRGTLARATVKSCAGTFPDLRLGVVWSQILRALGRCVEWSCGHGMFPKELGIRLSCAWWPCGLCLVDGVTKQRLRKSGLSLKNPKET